MLTRVHIVIWLMGGSLLLAGPGCGPASNGSEQPDGSDSPTAMPADFQVSFGKGGGVTGLWEGYDIAADGTVSWWRGRREGENAQPAGSLAVTRLDTLWRRVSAMAFFALPTGETGNMTGYIEVTANGQTHAVRWPVGVADSAAAAPYEQLYALARTLAEEARQP